jgi:hypothetical protein
MWRERPFDKDVGEGLEHSDGGWNRRRLAMGGKQGKAMGLHERCHCQIVASPPQGRTENHNGLI